jgi:hypothetical protein
MIRREQRRIDRAFSALLLALVPSAAAQACSSMPTETAMNALDASQLETAPPDDLSDSAKPPKDAGVDARACLGSAHAHDAAAIPPDADAADFDADVACDYAFPCGLPQTLVTVGCEIWVPYPDGAPGAPLGCKIAEGQGCDQDAFSPTESGALSFTCKDCVGGGGRKPTGLRKLAHAVRSPTARGAYFARMAYDEAASVHAFVIMRDELSFHGAPRALVRGAERAARDEIRHAKLMVLQADAEGTSVPKARVRRRSEPRTLLAIARQNAVEGCVNETFGALLLRWQAANADDPATRRTFARIAKDEARHAALSWAVARWIDRRLDDTSRRLVANARRRAMHSLERAVEARAASSREPSLGRPDAAEARALVAGLAAALGLAR